MYAIAKIAHAPLSQEQLVGLLTATFGPHDDSVLGRSELLSLRATWSGHIMYARQLAHARLSVLAESTVLTDILIEPLRGSITQDCDDIWRSISVGLHDQAATVRSLMLVDTFSGVQIATAGHSWADAVALPARREAMGVGLVTIVITMGVALTTDGGIWGALLAGSPAVAGLGIAIVLSVHDWLGRRLHWRILN